MKQDDGDAALQDERRRLLTEIARLEGRLAGLDRAIEILRAPVRRAPARLALPAPAPKASTHPVKRGRPRQARTEAKDGAEVERLRRLWADPSLSTAQIARELNWSWIAVKNNAARLGLPERPSRQGKRTSAPSTPAPASKPPAAGKAEKLPPGSIRCAECAGLFRPSAPDEELCGRCR